MLSIPTVLVLVGSATAVLGGLGVLAQVDKASRNARIEADCVGPLS